MFEVEKKAFDPNLYKVIKKAIWLMLYDILT